MKTLRWTTRLKVCSGISRGLSRAPARSTVNSRPVPPKRGLNFAMAQRDNRHSIGYLTCTTPQPALRAVVRCSQVPRWGQTK
jgi:hypothetical protein